MDIQSIQNWLTKSIWGVLVLGTIGSIIGTIVIFFIKSLAKKVMASKEKILMRLMYSYGRQIEIGCSIRNAIGPTTKDGQFLAYHTYNLISYLCDHVAFLLSLTLTAYVGIAYGIDRPYLLSSLIALNIIFFHISLKSGLRVSCHVHDSLDLVAEKINEQQPKSFHEWFKSISKKK